MEFNVFIYRWRSEKCLLRKRGLVLILYLRCVLLRKGRKKKQESTWILLTPSCFLFLFDMSLLSVNTRAAWLKHFLLKNGERFCLLYKILSQSIKSWVCKLVSFTHQCFIKKKPCEPMNIQGEWHVIEHGEFWTFDLRISNNNISFTVVFWCIKVQETRNLLKISWKSIFFRQI